MAMSRNDDLRQNTAENGHENASPTSFYTAKTAATQMALAPGSHFLEIRKLIRSSTNR
jgi:hypothetical protein